MNKKEWIYEIARERSGVKATEETNKKLYSILGILGFFTWGLAWLVLILCGIFEAIFGNAARNRLINKYIKEHCQQLDAEYEIASAKYKRRMEKKAQGIPTCPNCESEKVEVFTHIENSFSGKYEYGEPQMVCKVCGHIFKPGT